MSFSTVLAVACLVVLLLMIVVSIVAAFSFAPWVPSSAPMAARALALCKPQPNQTFVDIGCGDGRIVTMAYRRFGLRASGVEVSLLPYLLAKLRQLRYIGKPVSIRYQNLFNLPLGAFDIIYIYGLPRTIREKLLPKLLHETHAGTIIISYTFSLHGLTEIEKISDRWRTVRIYRR